MQFKYILYLLFLTLFACEHHSKNINIENKPEDKKIVVKKEKIKVSSDKNEKKEIIKRNIIDKLIKYKNNKRNEILSKTEATKVDFFTLVRGEDK